MPAQMIYLFDSTLRCIDNDFERIGRTAAWRTASQFGPYTKRDAVFFTDGKDHPTWGTAHHQEQASGTMLRVINKEQGDMTLTGTVVVDVASTTKPHLVGSLMVGRDKPSFQTHKQTFKEARRSTMQILVHELRHVLISWSINLRHGLTGIRYDQRLYEEAYKKDGYNNPFERDAFMYAGDWIIKNGQRVDNGEFDDVLPLDMIRHYTGP